jgi:hypothetical protein
MLHAPCVMLHAQLPNHNDIISIINHAVVTPHLDEKELSKDHSSQREKLKENCEAIAKTNRKRFIVVGRGSRSGRQDD